MTKKSKDIPQQKSRASSPTVFTERQTFQGGLVLPVSGVLPASPVEGQVHWHNLDKIGAVYDGTAWKSFLPGAITIQDDGLEQSPGISTLNFGANLTVLVQEGIATISASGGTGTGSADIIVAENGVNRVVTLTKLNFVGTGWTVTNQLNGVADIEFAGGVPDHNDTTNIQGGSAGEYYHLTSLQSTGLVELLGGGDTTLHTHSTLYAALTHDHDSDYAALTHDHASVYAVLGHDHDSDYAALVHTHDTLYAALVHNHDTLYAPLSHNHDGSYISAADVTTTPTADKIPRADGTGKIDADWLPAGSGGSYEVATDTTDGLMAKEDRIKMDSIEAGARTYPVFSSNLSYALVPDTLDLADSITLSTITAETGTDLRLVAASGQDLIVKLGSGSTTPKSLILQSSSGTELLSLNSAASTAFLTGTFTHSTRSSSNYVSFNSGSAGEFWINMASHAPVSVGGTLGVAKAVSVGEHLSLFEMAAPAASAGSARLYADSTTHKLLLALNGGAWSQVYTAADFSGSFDSHGTRHKHGGADEVATATPAANAIPKADGTGKLDAGWIPQTVGLISVEGSGVSVGDTTTLNFTSGLSAVLNGSVVDISNAGGGSGGVFNSFVVPEFPNAVIEAVGDGGSSGFDAGFDGTGFHNYYSWSSDQSGVNEGDVIVQLELPANVSEVTSIEVFSKVSADSGGTKLDVDMYGTDNVLATLSGNMDLVNTAWAMDTVTVVSGTFDPGGIVTLRFKLTVDTNETVFLGRFKLNIVLS